MTVEVVRAWPRRPPPGRPHVIDNWPRVAVDDYDYTGLAERPCSGVVSMDWDTAVAIEELRPFVHRALERPGEVLVAPVKMYVRKPWSWNVERIGGDGAGRQLEPGETHCHYFGFGLVYLPVSLVRQCVDWLKDRPDPRMMDTAFAGWHYHELGREARVDWMTRPVHLHYDEAETGRLT